MKPFDDKFAENVREVFDNWSEPVDEKAWQQMKSRLSAEKAGNRIFALIPVYARYAAAAVIILAVSATVWIYLPRSTQDAFVSEYSAVEGSNSYDTMTEEVISGQDTITQENVTAPAAHSTGSSLAKAGNTEETTPLPVLDSIYDHLPRQLETIANYDGNVQPNPVYPPARPDPVVFVLEGENSTTPIKENGSSAETNLAEASHIEKEESPIAQTDNGEIQFVPQSSPKGAEDLPLIQNGHLALDPLPRQSRQGGSLEVSAGSMMVYSMVELAEGVGFSAGVSGNWPVTEKLSILGGGNLIYNQFRLGDPYSASGSRRDESAQFPDDLQFGSSFISSRQSTTDFEFTALDIPLNMRYQIAGNKNSKLYLSAGLSSLLYLQQNYTLSTLYQTTQVTSDRFGNHQLHSTEGNVKLQGDVQAFRRFDLGRLVNFSVGYLMRRERYDLLIEPYVKYPLGDVTSLDMQIGMVGFSVKYNFSGKKTDLP